MDITDDEPEYEYPSYKEQGSILVRVTTALPDAIYRWGYDVIDYDCASSVFYISEGVGFDFWFDHNVEFPHEGLFVIRNIIGHYTRGDGWETDDDEDWECDPAVEVGLDLLRRVPWEEALCQTG